MYYKRIFAFIKVKNILNDNQFGFRPNTSTSHAIRHVITNLLEKVNIAKPTVFITFDLKKAFDLISHDLILLKLAHYGVRVHSLNWLQSYLSNRRHKIKCNGDVSTCKNIISGIP